MLTPFENNLPRRIRFGRGVSGDLAAELARLGHRRPHIVTDAGVRSAGILTAVTSALEAAGIHASVYDATEPEPPFTCVTAACDSVRAAGAVDVIVALGGGSVMDTAKLVAATARDGRDAQGLAGIGKVVTRPLPLVCLPTTAGTGSEATPVAIFSDPVSGSKSGVVDSCLVPDLVLLDPELTDRLPPGPTAAAGMDALVHALEAFIAKSATPLARGLALEAARRIGPSLTVACRNGGNLAARDAMLLGAHLAGLAFANSSCCAVHALALPLGGRFHIAHGVTTGCLVGATMRHNLPAIAMDVADFTRALGWDGSDPSAFPDQLDELADGIGLREALRRTPVPEEALAGLAREAVANRRLMAPNPQPIDELQAVEIYRQTLGLHA